MAFKSLLLEKPVPALGIWSCAGQAGEPPLLWGSQGSGAGRCFWSKIQKTGENWLWDSVNLVVLNLNTSHFDLDEGLG